VRLIKKIGPTVWAAPPSYFGIDITYLGDGTWREGEGHEVEVAERCVPLETKKRVCSLESTNTASLRHGKLK
jgi:hypothetical protein